MAKGLELPVTAIVVIALAVLILLAVGTFFTQNVAQSERDISTQADLAQGCAQLRSLYACDAAQLDTISFSSQQEEKTLRTLCSSEGYDDDACLRYCGCGEKSSVSVPSAPQAVETRPGSGIYGVDIL